MVCMVVHCQGIGVKIVYDTSYMLLNEYCYTLKPAEAAERRQEYLASVEMSIDLDDDLVIFIRCLFPGDHHLSCCQVLQLIHLQTQTLVTLGGRNDLLAELFKCEGKKVEASLESECSRLNSCCGNRCMLQV